MNKIIVFASSNEHKVSEVRDLLTPHGFEVLSLNDLALKIEAKEDGKSFAENALIKAQDIAAKTNFPVLADDSGLSIHALKGFPGIYSARYMADSTYKEKCDAINEKLNEHEDKSCSFICALCYIDRNEMNAQTFIGETRGKFMPKFDEKAPDQFGYDPCFYSLELHKTFGNATKEEKNSVSHRSKAIKKFLEYYYTLSE